jgi:hypothetical protein
MLRSCLEAAQKDEEHTTCALVLYTSGRSVGPQLACACQVFVCLPLNTLCSLPLFLSCRYVSMGAELQAVGAVATRWRQLELASWVATLKTVGGGVGWAGGGWISLPGSLASACACCPRRSL